MSADRGRRRSGAVATDRWSSGRLVAGTQTPLVCHGRQRGHASSASYGLTGTAGQPAVGLLAGDDYIVGCGFWGGGEVLGPEYEYRVYLPLVTRSWP
jgi:hypothetical protein